MMNSVEMKSYSKMDDQLETIPEVYGMPTSTKNDTKWRFPWEMTYALFVFLNTLSLLAVNIYAQTMERQDARIIVLVYHLVVILLMGMIECASLNHIANARAYGGDVPENYGRSYFRAFMWRLMLTGLAVVGYLNITNQINTPFFIHTDYAPFVLLAWMYTIPVVLIGTAMVFNLIVYVIGTTCSRALDCCIAEQSHHAWFFMGDLTAMLSLLSYIVTSLVFGHIDDVSRKGWLWVGMLSLLIMIPMLNSTMQKGSQYAYSVSQAQKMFLVSLLSFAGFMWALLYRLNVTNFTIYPIQTNTALLLAEYYFSGVAAGLGLILVYISMKKTVRFLRFSFKGCFTWCVRQCRTRA